MIETKETVSITIRNLIINKEDIKKITGKVVGTVREAEEAMIGMGVRVRKRSMIQRLCWGLAEILKPDGDKGTDHRECLSLP